MLENVPAVEWCSLCNSRIAHGTLNIEEPGTGNLIPLPACVYCVAGIDNWVDGKLTFKD